MFKVNKIEKINKSKANIPMTVRFPEDIYTEYKKLSDYSGQSFNSLVISALRKIEKLKLISQFLYFLFIFIEKYFKFFS